MIKGTDKDMKCRDFQYELGKTYYVDNEGNVQGVDGDISMFISSLPTPKLCNRGGLHYCDTLEQVFTHYSSGRYFEIEVLGEVVGDDKKKATNAFKFTREISTEEVKKYKHEIKEEKIEKVFQLETIRNLQTEFPNLILGGSISLYLHGIRLQRFDSWCGDFDFILPFWQDLSQSLTTKVSEEEDFFDDEGYGSSSDEDFQFHSRFAVEGRKADVRINPKEKYEVVEFKGFKYKVAPFLVTLGAKIHYAKGRNGEKHKADVLEMINFAGKKKQNLTSVLEV